MSRKSFHILCSTTNILHIIVISGSAREDSIQTLVTDTDVIILAIASGATRDVVSRIKPFLNKRTVLLNVAKALDSESGKRLSEVISDILPKETFCYAALAGGTIAHDLFGHQPLGIDIASENHLVLESLRQLFESETLNVYTTTDLKGLEYASSFKNIISILAGIVHGLGFSYGSETHLISRAAREVQNLAISLGATPETFSMASQCWGNDLWMSCTGSTRNREFGIYIGKGNAPETAVQVMREQKKTVEGLSTLRIIKKLINSDEYPILHAIHSTAIEGNDARTALQELMRCNHI
ncbi:MAG: NAD(P)H-dependent glycerol-3-phosphate dehydrogenase [Nanoarchaeota archaeon]